MDKVTITLPKQHVEFVLMQLGELPTKSNAFVVVQAIQAQLAQIEAASSQVEESPELAEVS